MKSKTNLTYHCFDWDDNLVYMPTNIIAFHKDTKEELILSTEDFSHYRSEIGQDIKFFVENNKISHCGDGRNFKDYEIIGDGEHESLNSFREFRDCEKEYFITHLKEVILNKSFGPEWDLFLTATNSPSLSRKVYIITARGQSANTIYEGIKYLKECGLIKNHILRKNIFPVSHSKFKGNASSPQALKLKILKMVFTKANTLSKKAQVHHTVYFSDDDLKTMTFLQDKLSNLRETNINKINYWQHIHIRLRYTGTKAYYKELFDL